jgi:stress response protein YsnF
VTARPNAATSTVVVPVVAEEVHVETLSSETDRIVVRTHVETETVRVETPRVVEDLSVERVRIGRTVEAPIGVRQEGDTTIVSVVEEVAVVVKQYVLVEEIRVTKRRTTEPLHADVTLRREVATVEPGTK